jgi:protein-tyrosine-phosphatase
LLECLQAQAVGSLVGLVMASGTIAAPAASPSTPPTVVFVCEHGSAKSLLAASLFERMARERGVAARAISRGIHPDPSVPELVVKALGTDGFDVGAFRPQPLTPADIAGSVRVVAIGADIGPLAAEAGSRLVRWDGVPPFSTGYAEARRDLIRRIDRLLREVRPAPGTKP